MRRWSVCHVGIHVTETKQFKELGSTGRGGGYFMAVREGLTDRMTLEQRDPEGTVREPCGCLQDKFSNKREE